MEQTKAFTVVCKESNAKDATPWKVLNLSGVAVAQYNNRKNANQEAKRLNASYEAKQPKPLDFDRAVSHMESLGFERSTISTYLNDSGAKNINTQDTYAMSFMPEYNDVRARTKRFVCKPENGRVAIRAWWF